MILAHVLHTEAIRVLLPVATALVDERVASFAAALMAGVARKYGGDPDHLAIITATMRDQETGRDRQFLVLHDTLPGGTGYLHRLADQEELRQVLVSAREVVAGCRCADDGKPACHRCLLSHIDDDKWHLVSRAEALSMLDDLLKSWTTTSVASTKEISLAGQVESELEARFWKVLTRWVAAEPAISLTPAATVNGRSTAALRTDSAHWQVTMHHRARGTIPDLEFARTDQDSPKVVVYLDGYKYHAAPDKNRVAEDADKRAGLRAAGTVVFQFDWEAVSDMAGEAVNEDMPWPPYQGNAQARARTAYQKAGGDPAELPDTVWCNPVRTLFAYLTDPDQARWLRRAEAAVAGLLTAPSRVRQENLTERIVVSLLSQPLPPGGEGAFGSLGLPTTTAAPSPSSWTREPGTRRTLSAGGPRWPSSTIAWRRSRRILRPIVAAGRRGCTGGTSSSSYPTGPVTATRSPTQTWKGSTPTCWWPRSRSRAPPGCAPTTR